MAIDVKILPGGISQDFLNGFAGHYQNSQASIDLKNEKEKKKWKKILNLDDKDFDEAIKKYGAKIRDLRLGLRVKEPE